MSEFGPIKVEQKERMNKVGKILDDYFNPDKTRKWGFALFVFPFGLTPHGRINYLSNASRRDMLIAMKEFIAKHEGMNMPSPETKN